ncbi:MAG: hypothetical protein WA863_10565, partial [Methyloceanibacter sp.]
MDELILSFTHDCEMPAILPVQAFAHRLNGPCGTCLGPPDIEPRSSHNTDRPCDLSRRRDLRGCPAREHHQQKGALMIAD